MKASFKILFVVAFLALSSRLFAEEKSKTIKRNFTVSPSTQISVDNRFGKIHVNTWDKNEVNVVVVVTAEGRDPDKILDHINITFNEGSSSLDVATELKDFSEKRSSFSIDYTIDLPKNNRVKLKNKFGDVYLGDLNNDADLEVQYGNLKTGMLKGKTDVNLEFGSAMSQIAYIKSGTVNIKYSKLTVDKSDALVMDSQFSDVFATYIAAVDLQMKYGKFIVGKLGKTTGNQSFSEFRVDNLFGDIDLEVKHNQIDIQRLSGNIKNVQIDGQFSQIDLGLAPDFSASFKMDFQFADLKHGDKGITFKKVIKEPTKNYYEGFIGKSGASSTIVIDSKYGDVRLALED